MNKASKKKPKSSSSNKSSAPAPDNRNNKVSKNPNTKAVSSRREPVPTKKPPASNGYPEDETSDIDVKPALKEVKPKLLDRLLQTDATGSQKEKVEDTKETEDELEALFEGPGEQPLATDARSQGCDDTDDNFEDLLLGGLADTSPEKSNDNSEDQPTVGPNSKHWTQEDHERPTWTSTSDEDNEESQEWKPKKRTSTIDNDATDKIVGSPDIPIGRQKSRNENTVADSLEEKNDFVASIAARARKLVDDIPSTDNVSSNGKTDKMTSGSSRTQTGRPDPAEVKRTSDIKPAASAADSIAATDTNPIQTVDQQASELASTAEAKTVRPEGISADVKKVNETTTIKSESDQPVTAHTGPEPKSAPTEVDSNGLQRSPLRPASKPKMLTTAVRADSLRVSTESVRRTLRSPARVRARKVRRVVRHIDPWSVLTFSVLFHLTVFSALLLGGVLMWQVAKASGTLQNMEDFIQQLGSYESYKLNGWAALRAGMAIAGIFTLASTILVVILTVIFNLISDLVGGIRVTVVQEETVRVQRE